MDESRIHFFAKRWAARYARFALAAAFLSAVAETTFAVMLIAGIDVRYSAFGSAILLFWFAAAMLVYTGLKLPLDYSVFAASACALVARAARATIDSRPRKPCGMKSGKFRLRRAYS